MIQVAKPYRGNARPGRAFDRSYRVLEYAFRLRTDLHRVGVLLGRYLAPFRAPSSDDGLATYDIVQRDGSYPFVLYRDGRRIQSAPSYPDLLDYVFAMLHATALEGSEEFLAVHASAASWKGRGFVFPAPMDSGKTTLVAGLVRAGFDYLTDEAALFDAGSAELHPFPKALWMEPESVRALPGLQRRLPPEYRGLSRLRCYVRPEDLRLGTAGESCPLRYVIAPSFRGGEETRLERMSRAEALIVLTRNSFNFRQFGARGLDILRRALEGAGCFSLRMGDLESAVRAVMALGEKGPAVA